MSVGSGNGEKHRAETKLGMLAALTPEARQELDEVAFRELVAHETTETREQIQRQAKAIEQAIARAARSDANLLSHIKISEARVLQRFEQGAVQLAGVENRILEDRLAREHDETRRKVLEREIDSVRVIAVSAKERAEELGMTVKTLDDEIRGPNGERRRRELPSLNHEDLEDTAKHLIADRLAQAQEDRAIIVQAAKAKLEDHNAAVQADIHVTTEHRLLTPRVVKWLLAPTGIVAAIIGALVARGC